MTDRYKGFLVTLEKETRKDDSEQIINALKMIRGVKKVKPYINGAEDWMMYEKGFDDSREEIYKFLRKEAVAPTQ